MHSFVEVHDLLALSDAKSRVVGKQLILAYGLPHRHFAGISDVPCPINFVGFFDNVIKSNGSVLDGLVPSKVTFALLLGVLEHFHDLVQTTVDSMLLHRLCCFFASYF